MTSQHIPSSVLWSMEKLNRTHWCDVFFILYASQILWKMPSAKTGADVVSDYISKNKQLSIMNTLVLYNFGEGKEKYS